MRKYLGYILLVIGFLALAGPPAFAAGVPHGENSSLTLAANDTVSPALTDTPTDTPTPAGNPTLTYIPTFTATNTPPEDDTPINTPISTDTPVLTGTPTSSATGSPTPGDTPSQTDTPTGTSISTGTPALTGTPTLTSIPTNTSTITPTWTPTTSPTPGTLDITNPQATDFAGITLNGANQTTTAALASFVVSDLRGSGVGWHVTAQAARFTSPTGHSLSLSSLTMFAPTVAGPGTLPTIVAGPYTIDLAGPFQIASAPVGTGLGAYTFSAATLTLAIPASAYADTYNSTITISVITAP